MDRTIKIRILNDTPFDLANTELSLIDFRAKYNWICTSSTTDEELLHYLQEWEKFPKTVNTIDVGYWFKVIVNYNDEMPLEFIFEGIFYSKQMDGNFHQFTLGSEIKPENSFGCVSILQIM
jgi:hypothetical protein